MKPQKAVLLLFIGVIGAVGLLIFNRSAVSVPHGRGVYVVSSWSPDSRYLLFSYDSGNIEEAWLHDSEKNEYIPLNIGRVSLRSGSSWLNNETVVLVTLTKFQPALVAFNVINRTVQTYQITPREWYGHSINPSSASMVYSTKRGEDDNFCLYELDSPDRTPQAFSECDDIEVSPVWSHDGKRLASLVRGGLNIRDVEGAITEEIVVNIKGGLSNLSWSSDSSAIVFIGNYDAPGLYFMYITDNPVAGLIKSGDFSYMAWSPDNRRIAYTTVGSPGENTLHIEEFNPQPPS